MRLSPSYYQREKATSEESLPLVCSVGTGPVKTLPPYSWGAHRSRLVKLLKAGHYDVELDAAGWDRVRSEPNLHARHQAVGICRRDAADLIYVVEVVRPKLPAPRIRRVINSTRSSSPTNLNSQIQTPQLSATTTRWRQRRSSPQRRRSRGSACRHAQVGLPTRPARWGCWLRRCYRSSRRS